MTPRTVQMVSGTLFAVVALAHLIRAAMGTSFVVGGFDVPQWPSVLAVLVAGSLSVLNFRIAGRTGS
ncbi:MAG: hypothetical protein HYX76_14325 [Acidobacteria bacterium]|nr:hypothetical protein [Acidobacteriota bacterium]